jgi:hypothetical protein
MKPYLRPSLVRSRWRRILLPCFANAKPLPEAGNNNYLVSECDHLPEAGNIYIGIHPSVHTSVYSLWAPPKAANVAKLIRRRRISLKRDNHPYGTGPRAGRGGIAAVGLNDEFEHGIVKMKHDPFGFVTRQIFPFLCATARRMAFPKGFSKTC